jgi:hypothetical protein
VWKCDEIPPAFPSLPPISRIWRIFPLKIRNFWQKLFLFFEVWILQASTFHKLSKTCKIYSSIDWLVFIMLIKALTILKSV